MENKQLINFVMADLLRKKPNMPKSTAYAAAKKLIESRGKSKKADLMFAGKLLANKLGVSERLGKRLASHATTWKAMNGTRPASIDERHNLFNIPLSAGKQYVPLFNKSLEHINFREGRAFKQPFRQVGMIR